ncbi:MAG: DUF4432 family protein [Ignavibacteriales bacterium]|nr:DUF4432 family protein [Ignavibacteriales bacterium]
MKLFGKDWPRRELEKRVGAMEQVGGVKRMTYAEGKERDVEMIRVRLGSGMTFWVSPMRGMDVSLVEVGGVPITWSSPNGDAHPAYYEPEGAEWFRTAAGGLLMTCGFRQVGAPSVDEGEKLGLHGRAHHLPAAQVSAETFWESDDYRFRVRGVVEETRVFGEYLRVTREITGSIGENKIAIRDVAENVGFETQPFMILYHFNYGFPLMDERTEIRYPSKTVVPREEETPIEGHNRWHAPEPNYAERVYYHKDLVTENGVAKAVLRNPKFPFPNGAAPLTVETSWRAETLPNLVQWKRPGEGTHVLGIEPTNCSVAGRAVDRERGVMPTLEPGERVENELWVEAKFE